MPLNCFTNYITLSRGCSPVTPKSGLYFDDHPEVTGLRLESLTNEDRASIQDLFNSMYSRALVEFEDDIQTGIGDKFRRVAIVSNVISHEYKKAMTATVAGAEWRGVYVEVFGSDYYDIALNYLTLWSDGAQTATLKVWDATTGAELHTQEITTEDGHNVIQLDLILSVTGRTKRLFIGLDHSAFVSVEMASNGLGSDCMCHVPKCAAEGFVKVTGGVLPDGDAALTANITKQGDGSGMSVNLNVICGIGNLICQHRQAFKVALWYRLAIEFWREVDASDRLNRFTLSHQKDEAKEKLFGNAANGVVGLYDQYKTKLDAAIAQLPAGDGYCFDCDRGVMITEYNP